MPELAVADVRALLVRTCDTVGFPSPPSTMGLAEWADEALDGLLVRGSKPWVEAHAATIDALDAALEGRSDVVALCLARARDVARTEGARRCTCLPERRGLASRRNTGADHCVICGGRAA